MYHGRENDETRISICYVFSKKKFVILLLINIFSIFVACLNELHVYIHTLYMWHEYHGFCNLSQRIRNWHGTSTKIEDIRLIIYTLSGWSYITITLLCYLNLSRRHFFFFQVILGKSLGKKYHSFRWD